MNSTFMNRGGQSVEALRGASLYWTGSFPLTWSIPVIPKCITGTLPFPSSSMKKFLPAYTFTLHGQLRGIQSRFEDTRLPYRPTFVTVRFVSSLAYIARVFSLSTATHKPTEQCYIQIQGE